MFDKPTSAPLFQTFYWHIFLRLQHNPQAQKRKHQCHRRHYATVAHKILKAKLYVVRFQKPHPHNPRQRADRRKIRPQIAADNRRIHALRGDPRA